MVLDFWATWCPACRMSLSELKELVRKYPERLVLISISADEKEDVWRDFVNSRGMTWPQTRDPDSQLMRSFAVRGLPTYIVIDGDGVIEREILGTDPKKSVAYRIRDTLKSMKELESNGD